MEAGVKDFESPVVGDTPEYPDGDPRDIIELNYDIYKPSSPYSERCRAIQKDMVLANLSRNDIEYIRLEFSLIETLVSIMRRNPEKYSAVTNAVDDLLVDIMERVSLSRGEDGFTAKLMRKTIHEQRQSMSYEMGRQKQREGGAIGKAKGFMGMGE